MAVKKRRQPTSASRRLPETSRVAAPSKDCPPPDPPLPLLCRDRSSTHIWLFTPIEWAVVLFILILSALSRLPGLSHPPVNTFDETHFGGFVTDYLHGVSFFDIHPPLGKLVIFAAAKMSGYDGSFNFSMVGAHYTSDFYVVLRLPSAIFSTLLAPLLTATLLLDGVPLSGALLVGVLMAFEFTAIVQGRLILTDACLYFFVCFTIFMVAFFRRRPSWLALFVQALSAACALSVKFTGACVLALIAFAHFKDLFGRSNFICRLCLRGTFVFVTCVAVLFSLISLHLSLIPNPGFGDLYMPLNFRHFPRLVQIWSLLKAMYQYNSNLGFSHVWQSKWYEWPFWLAAPTMLDSAYLGKNQRLLFIFNNPVSAFLSFVGFIIGIMTRRWEYSLGYFAAYAPLALVNRCMWTYHYEIPLIFGILAFCQAMTKRLMGWRRTVVVLFVSSLATTVFVVWFPWIYGVSVPREWHKKLGLWKKVKPYL
jgi:dolichyl-phosphate-mannose--protein O-mannosyl transferase